MKRMLTALLVVILSPLGRALGQSIAVSFDRLGFEYCATVPVGPATWYVLAWLGGPAITGITGAEFRLEGTPADWEMIATPNPAANVTFGDPIAGGCNIAFPECQTGTDGRVLLYTISGDATSEVVNRWLQVREHSTPSNPASVWPVLVLCDAPIYTQLTVPGGAAGMNNRYCNPLPVQARTWSQVKLLYERR